MSPLYLLDVSGDYFRRCRRSMLRRRTFLLWALFDIYCVFSKTRHSSGSSPVAHCENIQNSKHSACVGTSDHCIEVLLSFSVGPGALMGASLAWSSDTGPVLLRLCSRIALLASLYLPPHQGERAPSVPSATVGCGPPPELLGISAVSTASCVLLSPPQLLQPAPSLLC